MNTKDRIYLDNAATSWPKPEAVYQAVDRSLREVGAAAGRASYRHAEQSQHFVTNARSACARLLGIADPAQLAFTSNGSEALNLAIHGLIRPGDHVVTTVCEHNSVLRPLRMQANLHGVETTYVGCDSAGFIDPYDIRRAMQVNTRLVVINHGSNVTGAVQPVAEIAVVAHEHEALILVDAAQTSGCWPIDVTQADIDLLATGGHKGLLGPLGTGMLYVKPAANGLLSPLQQGGTGTESQAEEQPQSMPEKLEVGNLNVPALAGLAAAVQHLLNETVEGIHERLQLLTHQLLEGLSTIREVRLVGPGSNQTRVSVVSFDVEGYDPQEFAAGLDATCGIECRAGLHCAPRMHAALGSAKSGGLIRLSPGWTTTNEDIDQTLATIAALATANT